VRRQAERLARPNDEVESEAHELVPRTVRIGVDSSREGAADRAGRDDDGHRALEPEETGTRLGDDAAAAGDDRHARIVRPADQRRVIAS
jgi:hypothetical protein